MSGHKCPVPGNCNDLISIRPETTFSVTKKSDQNRETSHDVLTIRLENGAVLFLFLLLLLRLVQRWKRICDCERKCEEMENCDRAGCVEEEGWGRATAAAAAVGPPAAAAAQEEDDDSSSVLVVAVLVVVVVVEAKR